MGAGAGLRVYTTERRDELGQVSPGGVFSFCSARDSGEVTTVII